MVILSEKDDGLVPPPPYFAIESTSHPSAHELSHSRSTSSTHLPSSSSTPRTGRQRAPNLPSHVLLLIVYSTLPRPGEVRLDRATGARRRESSEEMAVRTTRTLYWMAFCLRGVNRGFYLASMHLLRSTLLPHYMQYVRAPYSSDPFPHTSVSPHRTGSERPQQFSNGSGSSSAGRQAGAVVGSMQCETEVLDLFILHQLHEDVFADDTSLHTPRPERLSDLFDFMQPRARLTDLVRAYGAGAGLVAFSEDDLIQDTSASNSAIEESRYGGDDETSSQYSFSSTAEKRVPELNLKAKSPRSTSTLTLVNPPGRSSSVYTQNTLPSPSASTVKFSAYSFEPVPFRSSPSPSTLSQTCLQIRRKKILYSSLRISFSSRRVGLVYTPYSSQQRDSSAGPSGSSNLERGGAPRTIVDVPRERDEPLERSASRLVAGLKAWMNGCY
ncbi:hypothetical protein ACEPAI_2317 [Sanghuangporus weigelae]